MSPPERSQERDDALDALTAAIPFPGWTLAALQGVAGPDADLLFPAGPLDMVESWCDLVDRRMPAATGERTPDRVRAAIAARLASLRESKDAVRRAVAILAAHPVTAAKATARTVDAVWHAAGDRSADWSWYTKRATLVAVYGAVLLYWLRDDPDDDESTLAFLDRQLEGVGRIGRLRQATDARLQRFRPRAAG